MLALAYLVLLHAFRSLLLPLMAVLLDAVSVAATYGLLVVIFRWGAGADVLGLYQVSQIEGWVPIFLFAMLFGLSMDYEVFFVSRMRESWDVCHDNARAVTDGLSHTGRVVSAAALIMVGALSGLVAGHVAGLQEIGAGLALGVLIDATIVRRPSDAEPDGAAGTLELVASGSDRPLHVRGSLAPRRCARGETPSMQRVAPSATSRW